MASMKKNIIKQIVVNALILVLSIIIFREVSYSMKDETQDSKELLIETGNMQVVLNVPKDRYELLDSLKISVPDSVGMNQEGYYFTVTNTGNIPIEYYEIRLMDEENKISTLPHNYLRYIINKDDGLYSEVKNLGEMDSIIYTGSNLMVGESSSFNLKMWVDENKKDIYNKVLYAALEITLYQKNEINDNYVFYDSVGENVPFRTSIYEPISSVVPEREGYKFLGWSTTVNGEIKYQSGDTYNEKKGRTLYGVWEKVLSD